MKNIFSVHREKLRREKFLGASNFCQCSETCDSLFQFKFFNLKKLEGLKWRVYHLQIINQLQNILYPHLFNTIHCGKNMIFYLYCIEYQFLKWQQCNGILGTVSLNRSIEFHSARAGFGSFPTLNWFGTIGSTTYWD